MSFAVGTIVKARNRQWVVLPDSSDDWLMVQPLGGQAIEVTGICTALEKVESDVLELPGPDDIGDFGSCRLLRDAIRLGFRASAGPFRAFGSIDVEPRPFQIVPLLMALRQVYTRLLICDDVGIGKTIEAALIAKELLARGEISRIAILCPPHLVPQWKYELYSKFHIDAEMVLPGTAKKLELNCAQGESLFERYPNVIVSLDFIKSDRHREEFIQKCPEFVIIDEAHTCAFGAIGKRGRHQRYELIKRISADKTRHLVLVTATPHSGNEDAFRSLLTFLNSDFAELPDDLAGKGNELYRKRLSEYLVQRNRADIREYEFDSMTRFPESKECEETFKLSKPYSALLDKVIKYTQEMVQDLEQGTYRQRVRWWSALALLRSLASSPAAATETMRNRADVLGMESIEEMDEHGQRVIMDIEEDDTVQPVDYSPGGDTDTCADDVDVNHKKLRAMALEAEALKGKNDSKLIKAVGIVKQLLTDGFLPILFCRFIPTAVYVAEYLREELRDTTIECITGLMAPAEREEKIEAMQTTEKRVLVCTDCLSEGINLQTLFNAVVHYDLSWNPTRHAQRIGRVDRFGQKKEDVRIVTLYGIDNKIDGIVLDILLRKHDKIRSTLGISVPVPTNSTEVVEAIFEGLLLRKSSSEAEQLSFLDQILAPKKEALLEQWSSIEERTKRNRTMFAQRLIKPDEVYPEIKSMQQAVGAGAEMRTFIQNALQRLDAGVSGNESLKIDISRSPAVLRDRIQSSTGFKDEFTIHFNPTDIVKGHYITRTHPIIETLSNYVTDTALDMAISKPVARRGGVIRTNDVNRRTTLLLVRYRFHIISQFNNETKALLAEDCRLAAFESAPSQANWLDEEQAEKLLEARPVENIHPEQQKKTIAKIIEEFDVIRPYLNKTADQIGEELKCAHKRVRTAAAQKGVNYLVEPKLPVDVIGIYIYLPG